MGDIGCVKSLLRHTEPVLNNLCGDGNPDLNTDIGTCTSSRLPIVLKHS